MGVYIPNMKMPEHCGECRFAVDGWCYAYGKPNIDALANDGRTNFCPLVPVPPHGRLIDADEMADVFRGFIAMYDSCPFSQLATTDKARRDELQAALAEVINAHTIIPAEEE